MRRVRAWWQAATTFAAMAACLLVPGVGHAQATLVLDADTPERIELRGSLAVLRDPGGTLDAAAVRAAGSSFEPLAPGAGLNFGYTSDAIWLRLRLQSADERASDWRIELDYASLDHAELHFPDGTVQRAGDRLAFDARALPHRNPLFAVALAPGESQELLLRVASEGSVTVNPTLMRAEAFRPHSENAYGAHAAYFGMLLALAGYNLLLFLALRDRVFGLYVLFVLAMGVGIATIYGLAAQYLWPESVTVSNRALGVSFAISGIVGPLFTRDFLDSKRRSRGWYRVLGTLALLHVGVLAFVALAPMRPAMQVMSLATMVGCIAMMGCGITAMWRGVPGARVFVLAWTALLLGGLLMALRNFGLMPTTFITLHGMQVGSAIEMLLLSFALAARFNQIKQEKAQAQAETLDAQRQLVASLQRQEHELAQRVAERTEELAHANEQLRELALRDPLTGLANRAALHARLSEVLARHRAGESSPGLLLVDLDGFKAVNDRHGHATGDRVLVEVATRLRGATHAQDLVARLGGDEFVIVVEDFDAIEQQRLTSAIETALTSAYAAAPGARIGASIGVATVAEGEDVETVLRRADTAMYAAKAEGRRAGPVGAT